MSRLRVGILGAGGIAGRHAGAIAALPERMELVAAVGRDPLRTAAFVAGHGGMAYTELDRMLDESRPDLVIVALPPGAHRGEVEAIAARAIHLLVEKPIALEAARGQSMVAAAEKAGVVAACGFMYRFGDAIACWQASDTGRAGLFAGSFHCNALHAPWWRDRAKSGGQMVEQLIHLVDLVRLFMGEPDTVYARAANLFHRDVPGYDGEDVSAILFGWDDGRVATLGASNISVPGRWQKQWRIEAERMSGAFADWNRAVLTRTSGAVAEETIAGTTDPFVAQLADLAEAIGERRAPKVPLREGLLTLRLALAARRSADERRELRLGNEG